MRVIFLFLLFRLSLSSLANMGPVWQPGVSGAEVFCSQYADILHETIHITIDREFKTAIFKIEYTISCDSAGKQIPLLFVALDFEHGFKVLLDGKPVELLKIPPSYDLMIDTSAWIFDTSFKPDYGQYYDGRKTTNIQWEEGSAGIYSPSSFHYFEVDLEKGVHKIQVEYFAEQNIRPVNKLKEYSFQYSLSPARHWRSFGTLDITLDAIAFDPPISSTLGEPGSGNIDSIATWHFDELPDDYFHIIYRPQISRFAEDMLFIGPGWPTFILAVILILLHLRWMIRYRKRKPTIRFSAVMILGSMVNPVLFFVAWFYCNEMIDWIVGPETAHWNDFGFFMALIFLLPVIFLFYWLIMWAIDSSYKTALKMKLIEPTKKQSEVVKTAEGR